MKSGLRPESVLISNNGGLLFHHLKLAIFRGVPIIPLDFKCKRILQRGLHLLQYQNTFFLSLQSRTIWQFTFNNRMTELHSGIWLHSGALHVISTTTVPFSDVELNLTALF